MGSMSQGAGGGAGGRRLFSDMPAHVQHLLEERQHFERVSPSRRTVYRKIVSGMQGSANPSMAYHLSGTVCVICIVKCMLYHSLIIYNTPDSYASHIYSTHKNSLELRIHICTV